MHPQEPQLFENLLTGIDKGLQAHVVWSQRLLRCALLHESPGEDMLRPDAHRRCIFGKWLQVEKDTLASFDAAAAAAVEQQHEAMHLAVRALCSEAAKGKPAHAKDLLAFEDGQTAMVENLSTLRQRVAESLLKHDELTGLPLRNGLAYAFRIRRNDAARNGQDLHVAMVDVDHFKVVNDTKGHQVGDLALQHLAKLMTGCLRENDIVVRYGGEEFLFLLLGPGAERVVRRLLVEVRENPMPLPGDQLPLKMTVTAGLTLVHAEDTLEAAIERADRALLDGKASGRDRYVMAPGVEV